MRLQRGQPPLQGKPCFASAFADPAYMPPDPNKASGGCGPRSPQIFIDRMRASGAAGSPVTVEKVEASTFSRISQGQLAPAARPAVLAGKALLRKRFCGSEQSLRGLRPSKPPNIYRQNEGFRRCRKPCDCRKSGSLHFFENISRAACACGAASRPCRESLASQALLRIRRTCRRIRTKPPGAAAPKPPNIYRQNEGFRRCRKPS